jgi:predicted nucleotidyltransferase
MNLSIVNIINNELSSKFVDYSGLYFYGSRLSGNFSESSDYDVAIVFGMLDYNKRLEIGGIIARIEYKNNYTIDYKLLTSDGKRSIDYIRKNTNPVFINQAIDKGFYIGRV